MRLMRLVSYILVSLMAVVAIAQTCGSLVMNPNTGRLDCVGPNGGSGTPGGSNGQIQYNNAGTFGGATGTRAGGTVISGSIINMFTADANLSGVTNYYNPVLQVLNGPTLGFGNGIDICNTTYAAGDCAQGLHLYQIADGTVFLDAANDSSKPFSMFYHPATAQLQITSMADMVWQMTNSSYVDTGTTNETAGHLNISLVSKVDGSSNGEPNIWFTAVSNDGTHSATMTEIGADIEYNNSGVFLSGANWHVFDFVNSKNVLYQNPVDAPDLLETTAQIGPGNNGATYTVYGSIASTAGALNLVSTLANGATDSINFKVGNNGGTLAGTVSHAGIWTLPVHQALNNNDIIEGFSNTPSSGAKLGSPIVFRYGGTITGWEATTNDGSAVSCSFDVWKANGSIPTVANTILTGGYLGLSSATTALNQGVGLFTTTAIAAGDIVVVAVHGSSSANSCQVQIHVQI